MMHKNFFILIGLVSLLAMGPAGCGDDSDNSGGDPTDADALDSGDEVPDVGSVTLTLSGEMERERAGTAEFILADSESIGAWMLSMGDASPRTFNLSIVNISDDPSEITRPGPGIYPIANQFDEPGMFRASYEHVGDYDQPYKYFYHTNNEVGGTLTIETSTEAMMSGSFEFRANRSREDPWSDEPRGEVEISGSFTALPRASDEEE